MAELDVEAVEEIAVDAPEYVLYGGKGGVGKTTMAAATGLASAAEGVATLVVSTDPAHSLSDAYGVAIGAEPTRVREGDPLFAVEIDPDAAMEEVASVAESGGLFGGLGSLDDLLGSGDGGEVDGGPLGLGGAMPGADEAAAIQQLVRFLDDDRFDRVVIDTAPTGHTLRLLELPEVLDTMVGRVLTLRERLRDALSGLAGVFGGDADAAEEAAAADLRTLRDRVERLRAVLTDPTRTDFRIVMVPEAFSVRESHRLLGRLHGFDVPVGTIVVNRVLEPLEDVVGGEVAAGLASPNPDHCDFCRSRWEVQQAALREAGDLFRGHVVKRVPLLPGPVDDDRTLRVVAACLA